MTKELKAGDLVRVCPNKELSDIFPDWAGQLCIVVEKYTCLAVYSQANIPWSVRRLHDGAEEWWYTSQFELPDNEQD